MPQYSLGTILAIWFAASLPMGLAGWSIPPEQVARDPFAMTVARVALLTGGLVWQFALVLWLVRREAGDLRLRTLRERLRLDPPRDRRSAAPRARLWLWLIPIGALFGLNLALSGAVERVWVGWLPMLAAPEMYQASVLGDPAVSERLVGAWWFVALFGTLSLFNVFLGEELLFHGLLLPRMAGVFGRADWLGTGVLFALYHVHQPWTIGANLLAIPLLLSLPARYFRSTWMSVIPHSIQFALVVGVLLALVRG